MHATAWRFPSDFATFDAHLPCPSRIHVQCTTSLAKCFNFLRDHLSTDPAFLSRFSRSMSALDMCPCTAPRQIFEYQPSLLCLHVFALWESLGGDATVESVESQTPAPSNQGKPRQTNEHTMLLPRAACERQEHWYPRKSHNQAVCKKRCENKRVSRPKLVRYVRSIQVAQWRTGSWL